MKKFEIGDENYSEETVSIDDLTDTELLEKREYLYGTYRNNEFLNKLDDEIRSRGLGDLSWQSSDKAGEINTSYDQNQEIGDAPQALYSELSNAEPIDAKTGEDFMDIDMGEDAGEAKTCKMCGDKTERNNEECEGCADDDFWTDGIKGKDYYDGEGVMDTVSDIISGDWIYTKKEKEIVKKIIEGESEPKEFETVWKQLGYESYDPTPNESGKHKCVSCGKHTEDGVWYQDDFNCEKCESEDRIRYGESVDWVDKYTDHEDDPNLDSHGYWCNICHQSFPDDRDEIEYHLEYDHNISNESFNDKYFDHHEYDPILEGGYEHQQYEGSGGYFTCKKCGEVIQYDGWSSDVEDDLDDHLESHEIGEAIELDDVCSNCGSREPVDKLVEDGITNSRGEIMNDPVHEEGYCNPESCSHSSYDNIGQQFWCNQCGKSWTDYLHESLNKDGTGVKNSTRGLNPNKTPRPLLAYVYVSKSDCEICKQYDGMTFATDSPNRPVIPRLEKGDGIRPFTHPHCKCKWVAPFGKADLKNFDQIQSGEVGGTSDPNYDKITDSYQCDICGRLFDYQSSENSNYDYTKHMRIHQIGESHEDYEKKTKSWLSMKGIDYDTLSTMEQDISIIRYILHKRESKESTPIIDVAKFIVGAREFDPSILADPAILDLLHHAGLPIHDIITDAGHNIIDSLLPRIKSGLIHEAFQEMEHPRDNDGKFSSKGGGSSEDTTTRKKGSIKNRLLGKYKMFTGDFVDKQIKKSESTRRNAEPINKKIQDDLKQIKNVEVSGRIKEIESMIGKLGRKPEEYRDVSELYDVSGVRAMAKDLNGVQATVNYIKENYDIITEKDNIDQDRNGYRSYHVIVRDESGVKSEIQVRTKNQDTWANWYHNSFYKPDNKEIQSFYNTNKGVIDNYSGTMSQYFYDLDNGLHPLRPDCPPAIEEEVGCMQ